MLASSTALEVLDCAYFAAGECRSCTWLGAPYGAQLARKSEEARTRLGLGADDPRWLAPVSSAPAGFRTKAKMVAAGTVEQPTLGILDEAGGGVDLCGCALHVAPIAEALPVLAELVRRAALTPYDVASALPVAQRGELKHVLVTASPDGELLVRLVLRSTALQARVVKHLAWLRDALPALRVLTINVQPDHSAVLEGEREIVLTESDSLPMRLGDITLHLGPRSFFQTNTEVARALYAEARSWTTDLAPSRVLDLYCGVGGFALHLAAPGRRVVGIEVSEDAVGFARRAAADASLPGEVRFVAGDATAPEHADLLEEADLVVVNPPRRGLGDALTRRLEASGVPHVLYSSCNPVTLARDLQTMGSYEIVRARLLDMFPQTPHSEVLVQLRRVG